MNNPFVSVCVPVYNGEQYLGKTISSLLTQDYENYEVVIIDNASTDSTPKIAKSFNDKKLRYVRFEELVSFQDNWSRSFDVANGKYLSICHADDTYEPNFISTNTAFLDSHPHLSAVFSSVNLISSNGTKIGELNRPVSLPEELDARLLVHFCVDEGYFPLICPTFTVSKSVAEKCGRFDNSFRFAADMDYYFRLLKFGNIGFLNEHLMNYRQHPAQGSVNLNNTTDTQSEFFRILEVFCQHNNIHISKEESKKLNTYKRWGAVIDAISYARFGNTVIAFEKTKSSIHLSDFFINFPSPKFLFRGLFSTSFLISQYLHLGKVFADLVWWYRQKRRS